MLNGAIRAMDGTGNNLDHPDWGSAGTDLFRRGPVGYSDGVSAMAGTDRPSPRVISNAVVAQGPVSILNERSMSDWVWQWGQFVDHDLDLTLAGPTAENVPVPAGDPFFDPFNTGTQTIAFTRSQFDPATGTGPGNPREQINVNTSYLDGSMVYGSDAARADALRMHVGGRLKTSPGDLLPLNNSEYFTTLLDNANEGPVPDSQLYVAGDVRANEQIGLTAIHTLFVREHNRIADELAAANPTWTDEEIYQRARKIVGAEIEAITYNEFLPALLGPRAPSLRGKYDDAVPASIATEFSSAAYRVGHTLLSPLLQRIRADGTADPRGPLALKDAFFNPGNLTSSADLEGFLMGLASQRAQEIDNKIVDALRNFLFGPPGAGGFDLASLNIQRGRDHGLPDYNSAREAFGLPRVASFSDITSNPALQSALRSLYGSVDNIDLWVGALAEDHLGGSSVGPTIDAILVDQFTRLRDCDRLFFTRDPAFTPSEVAHLSTTTLADVIRRNTGISDLQPNVFFLRGAANGAAQPPHTATVADDAAAAARSPAADSVESTGDTAAAALANPPAAPAASPGNGDPVLTFAIWLDDDAGLPGQRDRRRH